MNPEYSPDGRTIAFTSARSGSMEIWACDADGTNPRHPTSMGGPHTDNPRWSPDSRQVVFDSRREGSADLYVINSDGGPIRRLTSDPAYDGEARWSRDGRWIYFWSDRSGRSEIYRMPAGSGEASQITNGGGQCAIESPDGKWLHYCKAGPWTSHAGIGLAVQSSIWGIPLEGGSESQVHERFLSYPYNMVVADDGIYVINATEKGANLEFVDLRNGKNRTICRSGKQWSYGLSISPDHHWMLCSLGEVGPNDLMLAENFR